MKLKNNSRPHERERTIRSQTLRREMTASERLLWAKIRGDQLGFRFKRQVPMKSFYLDFYCPAAMLCLEVDGEQHEPERDQIRDRDLLAIGILTLRVPSLDLFDKQSARTWIELIYRTCVERTGREPFPAPLP